MPIVESTLTCPHCGYASVELMPTDACVFFHECAGCHTRLRPKPGDCCVFCSFGSVKCPPMQQAGNCCANAAASSPH
ncbi:MAG TPA: GDCCVxC domain-containing (seleno)protein [Terriglobia bacterium]|nr:GDCCVxC domain-containing (seleno)protein [Terriglobia bacterium]